MSLRQYSKRIEGRKFRNSHHLSSVGQEHGFPFHMKRFADECGGMLCGCTREIAKSYPRVDMDRENSLLTESLVVAQRWDPCLVDRERCSGDSPVNPQVVFHVKR